MLRTLQKSLWLLLGIIVVGVVIYYSQPKDPVYEGHKLSAWLMALNTGQDPLHGRADEALKTIGTNMFPTLMQWIRLKDSPLKLKLTELVNSRQSTFRVRFTPASEFRLRAVIAFQECGGRAKSAIPALASLLDDSEIVQDVSQALAGIGAESVPFLKEALHHKSAKLRASGADALALLGGGAKSATPDLCALLNDQFPFVRARAVMALGQIKSEPKIVLPALANCLNDPDADFRCLAVGAIVNYGEAARSSLPVLLKAITEALHDKSSKLRSWAASSLGWLGADAKSATPDLISLLSDQFPDVRRNAVVALGQIKSEPAIVLPALANSLNDTDAYVRQSAIDSILNYGQAGRSTVPVLLKALDDQEPGVRELARFALMKIDPEAAAKAGVK
jgi:HEAT repeat protein